MKKIVFLPLDERPCNADFPKMLFHVPEIRLVQPSVLGNKKQPAELEHICAFLQRECADADGLVLSMDMLLYGGLLPSRLHHFSRDEVRARFELIGRLREKFPDLKIFAFQTIMRCPKNSSAEEEPDYYGEYGHEIWRLGQLRHKQQLDLPQQEQLDDVQAKIPAACLEDYLARRRFNLEFVLDALELAAAGILDVLVIPQDDSSPYGFTAMDQQHVRDRIAQRSLQTKVLLYPGADELGCTLLTRMVLALEGRRPYVYVAYSSEKAPLVTPLYEDRPVGETIKYQLLAAGCRQAVCRREADFVLAVNCPSGNMQGAYAQPCRLREYTVERSLPAFMLFMQDCVEQGVPVTVGDIAFLNGGDLELVQMLNSQGLLMQVAGYAGWNTSSNTLGTAIAQGVHFWLWADTAAHRDFLLLRYLEDAGYCSDARRYVYENMLDELNCTYFDTRAVRGPVSEFVHARLEVFVQQYLSSIAPYVCIQDCWHPWKRMFEMGIKACFQPAE